MNDTACVVCEKCLKMLKCSEILDILPRQCTHLSASRVLGLPVVEPVVPTLKCQGYVNRCVGEYNMPSQLLQHTPSQWVEHWLLSSFEVGKPPRCFPPESVAKFTTPASCMPTCKITHPLTSTKHAPASSKYLWIGLRLTPMARIQISIRLSGHATRNGSWLQTSSSFVVRVRVVTLVNFAQRLFHARSTEVIVAVKLLKSIDINTCVNGKHNK